MQSVKQRLRRNYGPDVACRAGWTFEPTGSGHIKAVHPNGITYLSGSPSDPRARLNGLAQMKRIERTTQ
jgi:hypothetical protein